ncbi:MAG: hypothetical protein FJ145_03035 [Deltaproteobacteria bacterium]|nr:hypothetical protein [Deltaproteobacteria bacterium]
MVIGNSYSTLRDGPWTLWVCSEYWSGPLWDAVRERIAQQTAAKHPQTELLETGGAAQSFYLKTFYPSTTGGMLKDRFRLSKARRAQRVGVELAAAGFNVPLAIAAGERRTRRLLECAFLVTVPVAGVSLIQTLQQNLRRSKPTVSRADKWTGLEQLAREIRRFHDLGFVHGDLVATNVFIGPAEDRRWQFYFMDNDRTRRYPQSLPQSQWKRNLVQLNRMPLPGISLQDRMRFLRAYLDTELSSKQGAALARWLEEKTRQRRWECDRVMDESFRSLMRWKNSLDQEVKRA